MSSRSEDASRDPSEALAIFEELIELDPGSPDGAASVESRLRELASFRADLAERVRSILEADLSPILDRERMLDGIALELPTGFTVGPYRVIEELGRGGMGVVYLAERTDGAFDRKVAIKVLRRLGAGDEMERRFALERRLLARLEHPGITRILDGGITPSGDPYLVMDYVEGEPITEHCDRQGLSVEARLRLFVEVCDAVQAAHRSLVVHRDLKPANILVTPPGRPKLLDFGIAKLLENPEDADEALTVAGARPFTPDYASPEQILGAAVSTASDIYSLGVVLYELLCGERPFRVDGSTPRALVRSAESRRTELPSRRLAGLDTEAAATLSGRRGAQRRSLERMLQGDLDRIVVKALDPDPDLRYRSAEHLAEDVERYLGGLPVRARSATWDYRARKFVARNRLLVGALASVSLLVLSGFGSALWQWREAEAAGARAELAASRAESTNRFLVSVFEAGNPRQTVEREHKGPETPIREVLEEASRRLDRDLDTGPVELADLHHVLGDAFLAVGIGTRSSTHFLRALELRRGALGELHPDTARSWYYAATAAPTLSESIDRIRQSVAIEDQLDPPSSNYPWALADGALLLGYAGRFGEAFEWIERARPLVSGAAARSPLGVNLMHQEIRVALLAGQLEDAERVLSRLRSHSEVRADDVASAGVFDYYAATIAHLRGAVEEAERRAAAAARALRWGSASVRQHYSPRLILIHLRAANLDGARREAANLDAEALLAEPDYRAARALSSLGRLRLAEGDAEGCLELTEIATAVMLEEVIRPNLDVAEALAIRGECELAAGSAHASATLAESHRILVELLGQGSAEARRVGEAVARAGILASPSDAASAR